MASYQVTGRNASGEPLCSVSIGSVDQEQQVLGEMDVVNAVRAVVAAAPGVGSVVVRKFEQVITIV
ncbi:MAG: hypothetical protein HOV92_22230 [Streptomyces sp.]|nr:hypothetical protein [Streptomyces sp.]